MSGRPAPDRHEIVRRVNLDAVLRAIVAGAPVSRDEIAAATGLSRPTVIGLVAALEEQGLVRVAEIGPAAHRGAGRIATRYEADPRAAYVVGIDVGGTTSRAAVADLSGEILAEEEVRTTRRGGPDVVGQLAALARSVVERAGIGWDEVSVVSLGTPGVENGDGTIRLAENIPGLATTPVAAALRGALGQPVVWENDVNAAAVGECHAGIARGSRAFVLLSVGTGLGLGIVVDGAVLRGARGAAGEVAYLPIGADAATPAARRRGAFEVAASGSGVVSWYREHRAAGEGPPARRVTAQDVYAAAGRGEPPAVAAVQRQAELLAQGVLAVSAILDPEMVVLGGGMGTNPVLLEPLRRAVARVVPWPLRIEPSALGPRAGLVGAVHLGLQSVPRRPAGPVGLPMVGTGVGA